MPKRITLRLIIILSVLCCSAVYGTIIFNNKISSHPSSAVPDRAPKKVGNPVNQVTSGSIIYRLPNSERLTQIALDTTVDMAISGMVNRVKVEQSFTNPSNEWVEGVYVFPLPENSAVDRMTMHIGNRILEGQIKEREEARKIYQAAKDAGKKASLV